MDNGGLPDLFIVTGNVYPDLEKKSASFPRKGPRLLFRNLGKGRFEELTDQASPAISELHVSRGYAFGDFDNDGDLDVFIVNLNEIPSLLRNDVAGTNHWLKVKLIGTKSNRSGIGARVQVKAGDATQITRDLLRSLAFNLYRLKRSSTSLGRQQSHIILQNFVLQGRPDLQTIRVQNQHFTSGSHEHYTKNLPGGSPRHGGVRELWPRRGDAQSRSPTTREVFRASF